MLAALEATPPPVPRRERAVAYLDALASLQPRQLAYRLRRLLPPALLASGLRETDPPLWQPLAPGTGASNSPQSGPQPPPHLDGVLRAVGVERAREADDLWVSHGRDDLLFSFTLHAFDELARYVTSERSADGDAFWFALLEEWLEWCDAPALPGWHPYPLSRRVTAWSAALSEGGWGADLERRMTRSLVRQVRYLGRCVEHDIGGNHVLENAVALVIGGTCLGITRSARRGRRLLRRELGRQILADGGHLERSPSYHRELLERLSDTRTVLQRAGAAAPELDQACAAMETWLGAIAGPDGSLPRFNDSWDGAPVRPADDAMTELVASGFLTLRSGRDQVVLDVGPLCPPHLPPHAHADALSFVLWVDGKPLVVDPGSGSYHGPPRAWSRATATHNTVEVAGRDQCVFLGDFRAARLPRVSYRVVAREDDHVLVAAAHDGYRRLEPPALHRRVFCWLPGDGLVVVDAVTGTHPTRSRLHLAPGAEPDAGPLAIKTLWDAEFELLEGTVAPYLGGFEPGTVLEQRPRSGTLHGWTLLRSGAEVSVADGKVVVRRSGRPDVVFDAP